MNKNPKINSEPQISRAAANAVRPKLTVNQPNDRLEREADQVALQVTGTIMSVSPSTEAADIQRKCTRCHMSNEEVTPMQDAEVRENEHPQQQASGEQLPRGTQRKMENAFGHDFSRVRLHKDEAADSLNRQLNARAFTMDNHIYFSRNTFDPDSSEGNFLLAHELTHVIQQGWSEKSPASDSDEHSGGDSSPSVTVNNGTVPGIQRMAQWQDATVHESNNLASVFINGGSVGVTWPTLNGTTFWSDAEAERLINRPQLNFTSIATGGVDASVASVPDNIGSYDETVLAPGPWNIDVPKTSVNARYPVLNACGGEGNTTFRAIGMPGDQDMYEANRRHEDRHKDDHEVAFNDSIVPWDNRLTEACLSGRTFHGDTEADAEAMLYSMMRGTPEQMAARFMSGCRVAVVTYHSTPEGGPVTEANPVADETCSASSVESTNPS